MDAAGLLKLLSDSTDTLSSLYTELGHPPERLSDAVAALHKTLHAAVEGQVEKVQKEVDGAKQQLADGKSQVDNLMEALGENEERESDGRRLSRSRAKRISEASTNGQPLLPRLEELNSEISRLNTLYKSRRSQADKLTSQLDSFRPILGDYVPEIKTRYLPSIIEGQEAMPIVQASFLTQLSTNIDRCGCELTRRAQDLQTLLEDILTMWSELCLPPETQSKHNSNTTFDALVLRHLSVEPMFEEVILEDGQAPVIEFQGSFQPIDQEMDAFAGPDTPTKAVRGSSSSTLQSARSADTHFPPHVLQPTPDNIAKAQAKQEWLYQEKNRREQRIQELYDEVVELWAKFDVAQEEMDNFVAENSGSTMAVIESYESELLKMKELKKKHMVFFIGSVREQIESLWVELRLSDEEKEMSFPQFFVSLEGNEPAEMDTLLARHEARVVELQQEVESKAPVLKIIARYYEVLEEEKQLEESAKDSTRLMRGVRGDPGRLLREEKMRKRVKVQKPKLEAELLKAIPVWEAENERSFTIDGEPYYDKILALVEASNPALKKRGRVASVAATPGNAHSNVLQASTTQANRVAATPLRTPSGVPSTRGVPASTGAAANKKPRLLSSANPPRVAATPASAAHNGNLRARVPPASISASGSQRQASSSKIPMPGASAGGNAATFGAPAGAVSRAPSSFRPRPSAVMMSAPQSVGGRNISGVSVASDSTTLHYAAPPSATSNRVAYASAIPQKQQQQQAQSSRPPISASSASNGVKRNSVNKSVRRGPSMSLEGALATLAAAGYSRPRPPSDSENHHNGSIRSVAHDQYGHARSAKEIATANTGSGGNWARLDEEDEEMMGGGGARYADEMEVF